MRTFSDLEIVAVMTARDFCPFSRMADAIAGAVKSDAVLPPDPAGANLLAPAIGIISTEKRTEIGVASELASAISGKPSIFLPMR